MHLRRTHILILAASLFGAVNLQVQHGHLNAGAVGQNQGDRLSFANGDIFAESSGYVIMSPATTGAYAGFYSGGITITALPTSIDNGGPAAGASAPGSFLMLGIQSVQGNRRWRVRVLGGRGDDADVQLLGRLRRRCANVLGRSATPPAALELRVRIRSDISMAAISRPRLG